MDNSADIGAAGAVTSGGAVGIGGSGGCGGCAGGGPNESDGAGAAVTSCTGGTGGSSSEGAADIEAEIDPSPLLTPSANCARNGGIGSSAGSGDDWKADQAHFPESESCSFTLPLRDCWR